MLNLRKFIASLRKSGELVDVMCPVDPHLEIAEIHRRVLSAGGPALFFHTVKGSSLPVVTNLFGSRRRIEIALGSFSPNSLIRFFDFLGNPTFSNTWKSKRLLKKNSFTSVASSLLSSSYKKAANLNSLPLLTNWAFEGTPTISSPLLYAHCPSSDSPQIQTYQLQQLSKNTAIIHAATCHQTHPSIFDRLPNKKLSLSAFIGIPPLLTLLMMIPLPEKFSNLFLSHLSTHLFDNSKHPSSLVFQDYEIALSGYISPQNTSTTAPYGNCKGYYDVCNHRPIFHCTSLYQKQQAIYPAMIFGKPGREDFHIQESLQQFVDPLIPTLIPGVQALRNYGTSGISSITACVIKKDQHHLIPSLSFQILGDQTFAFTKILIMIDTSINLTNFKDLLTFMLERFNPAADLLIFPSGYHHSKSGVSSISNDKCLLLGLGEKKYSLPSYCDDSFPSLVKFKKAFCPGCLVIELNSTTTTKEDIAQLFSIKRWPLVVVTDDIQKALANESAFLWQIFTHFDVRKDLFCKSEGHTDHHPHYVSSVIIDARNKNHSFPELNCDQRTELTVTQKWRHYFPQGMETGLVD